MDLGYIPTRLIFEPEILIKPGIYTNLQTKSETAETFSDMIEGITD
jgi:hypothetical protein